MPTRTEFNASSMTARRFTGGTDEALARMVFNFRDEAGNLVSAKVPIPAFEAELQRYIDEALDRELGVLANAAAALHVNARIVEEQIEENLRDALDTSRGIIQRAFAESQASALSAIKGTASRARSGFDNAATNFLGTVRSTLGVSDADLRAFPEATTGSVNSSTPLPGTSVSTTELTLPS